MILAGGEGRRLDPLTRERAKPAVPFGGRYRIIDFVLSNFANSGLLRIKVLTQYKSRLAQQAPPAGLAALARSLDQFVEIGARPDAHRARSGSRARPTPSTRT